MDTKKQKSIINCLYIFLVISTILSFVPNAPAQMASLVLVIVTLCAAYYYRSRDTEDGLIFNHMTYMIGTIWIGTGFILLGMLAAAAWIYFQGDHTVIQEVMNEVASGRVPDETMAQAVMRDYMATNRNLLITASLPTIGPAILYFVYRVANGYGRAMKGYRIAKPKSWL